MNTLWRVLIDDEPVSDFSCIPHDGQHVYAKLVPEGDNKKTGAGMKIGGGILAAIGVAVCIFTAGMGSAIGIGLIGAGVGMLAGGIALYNINIPSLGNKNRETPEQDPSIRGSRNQMRQFGAVPVLLGKRRIYTDLAAQSHTWVDPADGAVYLYQLFCVGQKDMDILHGQRINGEDMPDTVKIDETHLKDFSSTGDISKILGNDPNGEEKLIQMRIHNDGLSMPEFFTQCFHEEQVNKVLKHETDEGVDGSMTWTTPDGTEEINVDIFFYNGLGRYDDKGNVVDASVKVSAFLKKADEDDSAYQKLGVFSPEKTEHHDYEQTFSCTVSQERRVDAKNIWDAYWSWEHVSGDSFTADRTRQSDYRITILDVRQDEYTSCGTTYYSDYEVTFSVSLSETTIISAEDVLTAHELRTKRFAIHRKGLEKASYTVKLTRVTEDSTDSKVIDEVYVGSVRAIKNAQPVRPETAKRLTLVELRIKASDKLNNVVDRLNFVAQSRLPVPDGNGGWNYALSSNPASAAMYAMQGEIVQQRLADSEIDMDAFSRLYAWCAAHGYECNAYVTESMAISDLLAAIASTCRAEILRMDGKMTVIQDIARQTPVQLFTPRNSHDYKETIALADIPDEMKIGFVDRNNGFAETSCSVYNTPDGNYAGNPVTSQDVTLWGVTDNVQARKLGMYKYAVTKHRAIIHTFSADFEYLLCRKGDWIKYAGDVALAGIAQGRIAARLVNDGGRVIGFECDEAITAESGKHYAARIRKRSGEIVMFDLANGNGTTKTLVLSEPVSAEDAPQEGDLFTFGERGYDSIDLVITDIQCGENLSADLTCVEYAPEIFGVDDPDFVLPEFDDKLSEALRATDAGNVSGWRTWTTFSDSVEKPEKPQGNGTGGGWHHVQTAESKWISTKTSESLGQGEWSEPSPMGQFAIERIKEIVGDGTTEVGNPDTVTGLVAVAEQDSIKISWNPVLNNGLRNTVKQYTVEISKDNGTSWAKLCAVNDSSAAYTFDRAAQADGYLEKETLLLWKFRVTTENIHGKKSSPCDAANTDVAAYLTWIPQKPTATLAAQEKGLRLLIDAPDMTNRYGSFWYHVVVSDGIGTNYEFTTYNLDTVLDCFGKNYFEREDIADFIVIVYACNEAYNRARGLNETCKSTYAGSAIDVSAYKGWKPATPTIGLSGQGRHLAVAIANAERYGELVTKVQISKDRINWYEPDLTSDPYSSVDNWKKEKDAAFNILGTSFYQKLPLEAEAVDVASGKNMARMARLGASESCTFSDGYITGFDGTGSATNYNDDTQKTYMLYYPHKITMDDTAVFRSKIKYHSLEGMLGTGLISIKDGKVDGYAFITAKQKIRYGKSSSIGFSRNGQGYDTTTLSNGAMESDTDYVLQISLSGGVITFDVYDASGMTVLATKRAAASTYFSDYDAIYFAVGSPQGTPSAGASWSNLNAEISGIHHEITAIKDDINQIVVPTTYYYRFLTVNITAQKQSDDYASFSFIAQGTGAKDVVQNAINTANIVDGAITALKIYVEELSAITANLGVITNGTLKGNSTNYWNLDTGEFRVGNINGDYFKCTPIMENGSIKYNIAFKASQFELTAIGTVIRGTFYVCPANAPIDNYGNPTNFYFKVSTSGVTFNVNAFFNNDLEVKGSLTANAVYTTGVFINNNAVIHAGNIGDQRVSYATTAATASNANNANHATNADYASRAASADLATNANHATDANYAVRAGYVDSLANKMEFENGILKITI